MARWGIHHVADTSVPGVLLSLAVIASVAVAGYLAATRVLRIGEVAEVTGLLARRRKVVP